MSKSISVKQAPSQVSTIQPHVLDLTRKGYKTIPDIFPCVGFELCRLILDENKISRISNVVIPPNVVTLSLKACYIEKFDLRCFSEVTRLRELNLMDNRIGKFDGTETRVRLASLRNLNLSNNFLND